MPITFASGLTAAAKDSKHRRTPSELQLRGGSLLCACGNLHQPCDCLLLLYATPCKSQASGKKFIFTSKYILPDITKTALPKQSRRKSSSGLRLPASTSHLERCSCLAGRGPNSSSLFQPLAAVVAVALAELRCTTCSLQAVLREFLSCFPLILRAFPAFCLSVIQCVDHKKRPFFIQQ